MSRKKSPEAGHRVRVPSGLHRQSRFFARTRGIWHRLGQLESAAVSDLTEGIRIVSPIYVTSLPRSGTTIVTEMLDRHPGLTAHRYSDFPNVWTPYWRNFLLQKSRRQIPEKAERAHKDRIEISNDSPEAVEEVLWMYFFPEAHETGRSHVLDSRFRKPEFDDFYSDHIRKLLAVRGAKRYLAKGNYNVARIRYIISLFPDAKFLVPVRDPVHHVASLMKQHRLFNRDSKQDPRIPLQLALSGHFEFGPRRSVVNFGDSEETDSILAAWQEAREVEGWSRYWAMTYRHLLKQIENHEEVRKACLLFSYEDLCKESERVIDRIMSHCDLPQSGFEQVRQDYCKKLSLPSYYQPDFDHDEQDLIRNHCTEVHDQAAILCRKTV